MIFILRVVCVLETGFCRSGMSDESDEDGLDASEHVVEGHGGAWVWVEALQGEEGVDGADEDDVVVPALSGAAFVVVESEAGLEFAVVMFNAPPIMRLKPPAAPRADRHELRFCVPGGLG
jgi:hypothetical protein